MLQKNLTLTNELLETMEINPNEPIIVPNTHTAGDVLFTITRIGNGAFYNAKAPTVEIPDSITEIGSSAFANCYKMKNITIPDNVTELGSHAFENCRRLETINLSENLKKIDYCTFYFCQKLKEIKIPTSITKIGEAAFAYCTSLSEITIPESVESVGKNAFAECRNLTHVEWNSQMPLSSQTIVDIFGLNNNLETINYHGNTINIKEFFNFNTLDKLIQNNTIENKTNSVINNEETR